MSVIILITGLNSVLAQIEVAPESIQAELSQNSETAVSFQITNTSSESVAFSFPAFTEENATAAVTGVQEAQFLRSQVSDEARLIKEYFSGVRTNLSASERAVIEQYNLRAQRQTQTGTLSTANAYEIAFETVTLDGYEFVLYDESPVSGQWSGFSADFIVEDSFGLAWASDFTVLLTTTPELTASSIVYQLGGNFYHAAPAENTIRFTTGGGSAPEFVLEEALFDEEIEINELYVWIGNGWVDEGTFTGEIQLFGLNGSPSFISSVSPASGELAPSESQTVEALFASGDLLSDTYSGNLALATSDANQPEIDIEATLTVLPNPQVVLGSDALDFGEIFQSASKTLMVEVGNTGNSPLEISSIQTDNPDFTVDFSSVEIPPFSGLDIPVTFTASEVGTITGNLSFNTNDAENSNIDVSLSGEGVETPLISVTPETLSLDIEADSESTVTFEITNSGLGTLNFDIPISTDENGSELSSPDRISKGLNAIDFSSKEFSTTYEERMLQKGRLGSENDLVTYSETTSDGLLNNNLYPIIFEELALSGYEFFPLEEALSGTLTSVDALFELIANESDEDWASDLTLLFIETDNINEITTDDILLQIGGSELFTLNKVDWGVGNSSEPGTTVDTSVILNTPVNFEEVYVWIGKWGAGFGISTWSGSIDLNGLGQDTGFITDAEPSSGSLEAGQSQEVTLTVNADGLIDGVYAGMLSILSNDPVRPVFNLDVNLNVSGVPDIELSNETLDFGNVFEGDSKTLFLNITNTGNGTLEIADINTDNEAFSIDESALTIPPFSVASLEVTYTAGSLGDYEGILVFTTNVSDAESVEVGLTGASVARPLISVEPTDFNAEVEAGVDTSFDVVITNNGSGELTYTIPRFQSESTATPNQLNVDATAQSALKTQFNTRAVVQDNAEKIQQRLKFNAYQKGIIDDADGSIQRSMEWLTATQQANGEFELLNAENALDILLDNFSASGGEFVLAGEAVSGSLSSIVADFELLESSGVTWANDLTVFISNSPDLDTINSNNILLQIGGYVQYADNFIPWSGGSSAEPGTGVQNTIPLDSPIEFEEVYVWIGNGWYSGGPTVWDGVISLEGLGGNEPFITEAQPATGTIAAGGSETLSLTLNAPLAGSFTDSFTILSNDPVNPEVKVTGSIVATGIPEITVSPEALDFGDVFTGATNTGSVVVTNTGTDDLVVSSFEVTGEGFSATSEEFTLKVDQSSVIEIEFFADNPGNFAGTLTLLSNAENGDAEIALSASAANPGILTLGTESFSYELTQNEMTQGTLQISNTGESDLVYTTVSMQTTPDTQTALNAPVEQKSSVRITESKMEHPFGGFSQSSSQTTLSDSGSEVLWYQPLDGQNAIVSTSYANVNAGFYSSDDFTITDGALIEKITAYGSRFYFTDRIDDVATGFEIYIYADDNGKPAGNPDDGTENFVFNLSLDFDDPGLTFAEDEMFEGTGFVEFDLQEATGSPLFLSGGRYWLVVSLKANNYGENQYLSTWYQYTSTHPSSDAVLIDPSDLFGIQIPDWEPLSSFLPAEQSNLAFKIEGAMINFLTVDPNQGVIAPGESAELTLMIDASDYAPGEYDVTLTISTNSPVTPVVEVPVSLTVTEGGNGLLWVNLQYPSSIEIEQGQNFHVHGMAQPADDMTADAAENMRMWVGFHTENKHPGLWEDTVWMEGSFAESHDEMMEFIAEAGSHLQVGEYYFATRFQVEDKGYVYGGFHEAGGGFWNPLFHLSGNVVVNQATNSDTEPEMPTAFELRQNYPNPFNPTTSIQYDIPEAAEVRLDVYNIQGQRVASLVNTSQNAGSYTINFDASRLSSGVYIYRLQAGAFVQTQKMTLLK